MSLLGVGNLGFISTFLFELGQKFPVALVDLTPSKQHISVCGILT